MTVSPQPIRTLWWEDDEVRMIDQTLLPTEFRVIFHQESGNDVGGD